MSAGEVGPPPELPELGGSAAPAPGSFWADWQTLLRNRLILGGLAALVVLLLATVVLVLMDGGDDDEGTTQPVAQATTASEETMTPLPSGALRGRMRVTASVRAGPDHTYTFLGTARGGETLAVVGRSEDEAWLQVIYPPDSTLRGWVDATLLDVAGDVSALAVAAPALGPIVNVPTSPYVEPVEPIPTEPQEEVPTEGPRPTSTRRPTRTPLPTNTRAPTVPRVTPTQKQLPTETPTAPS
jgi:uncharacterized protein YraI